MLPNTVAYVEELRLYLVERNNLDRPCVGWWVGWVHDRPCHLALVWLHMVTWISLCHNGCGSDIYCKFGSVWPTESGNSRHRHVGFSATSLCCRWELLQWLLRPRDLSENGFGASSASRSPNPTSVWAGPLLNGWF